MVQIINKRLDGHVTEFEFGFLEEASDLRQVDRMLDRDFVKVDALLQLVVDHQLLEWNPLGVGSHFAHEISQWILLQGVRFRGYCAQLVEQRDNGQHGREKQRTGCFAVVSNFWYVEQESVTVGHEAALQEKPEDVLVSETTDV